MITPFLLKKLRKVFLHEKKQTLTIFKTSLILPLIYIFATNCIFYFIIVNYLNDMFMCFLMNKDLNQKNKNH